MGTSNFSRNNSANVYAFCMGYDDVETGEYIYPESYEFDDDREYFRETLESKAKDAGFKFDAKTGWLGHDNQHLGILYTYVDVNDIEIKVSINVYTQSGYYEGACVDWEDTEYTMSEGGYSTDDLDYLTTDEILWIIERDNEEMSDDEQTELAQKTHASLVEQLSETNSKFQDLLNDVFSKCTQVFGVVGTFSNGETVYEKK